MTREGKIIGSKEKTRHYLNLTYQPTKPITYDKENKSTT